ncbi:alcohol dehydrogenase catalytic domain-containing protein [Pseudonocardia oroxyli]|uniref:alcohol dehydrogenase n=1 Tax=Pseudonocardia oroxyli TaxID=366584 RepID=A0A1G7E6S2_PSEOR|nr:alcohol dehydrogenase catalytic domain-containing protein [Pseudonocardia oroxyli]SDE59391.1 Alcohol dehydrogenase GroES-like domain-containing protein [Pseudonocardia oroxyli]
MSTTMRAAVVPALGAALEIRELPVPTPGPGELLVRMEASGICHTDIHAARGERPVKPDPPFVPGHEGIGTVAAAGGAGLDGRFAVTVPAAVSSFDAAPLTPIFDTVLGGISAVGSIVGTRQDLADAFALHAAGRTRVIPESRTLGDINGAIEEIRAGRVPARLVVDFR